MSNYTDPFLKPWKVILDALKGSKKNIKKDDHSSFLGPIGKLTDPIAITTGRDSGYSELVHEKIPLKMNTAAEPFVKLGHYGNPLYWYGKKSDNGMLNSVHDLGENKGADIAGLVAGAIFGGSALFGGAGGAEAGGGAGAGVGGGTGAGGGTAASSGSSGGGMFSGWDFGSMDWTDPNTYMRLSQMAPKQQQQQQPPPQRRGMMAQNTYKPQTIDQWLEYYGFNSKV